MQITHNRGPEHSQGALADGGAGRISGPLAHEHPPAMPPLDQLDPSLRKLVQLLVQAHMQPRHDGGAFVEAVIGAVYAHFSHIDRARAAPACALRKVRGGLAPWQERLVRETIGRNLTAPLTLAELASACGLSLSHFSRAFKQSMGAPPHRWVLQQRVAKAQDLLRKNALPLSDIALACGFNDQSHLSKGFKSVTGHSPRDWQRAHAG